LEALVGNPIPPSPPPDWENPPGTPCGNCIPFSTPLYLTVDLDGFTCCNDCYYNEDDGYSWQWSTIKDLNDRYTLTQGEGNPCRWYWEADILLAQSPVYNSDDCSGTIHATNEYAHMWAEIYKSTDSITVHFYMMYNDFSYYGIFYSTCALYSDCCNVTVTLNSYTDEYACDEGYNQWLRRAWAFATIREGRPL
jgi:hypothetical protein